MTALLAYAIALFVPAFALYVIRALDLFKTSKSSTLLICALWGALAAYPLAALVNGALHALLGYALVANLTAPIVEEILKVLVLLYFISQPSFHYFIDGAVYGFGAGIGFAIIENLAYINAAPSLSLAILRVLSTSLMHAMTGAVVGLSLGRMRRSPHRVVPLLGILIAVGVHVAYNNMVNSLSGMLLLLVAIGIGVGGAAVIALQIIVGLRQEKQQFSRTLGLDVDVSPGEREAIQRFGGASLESILHEMRQTFGEDNVALIRRLLVTQANIGILENNLGSCAVSSRLRTAWETEIAARQAESQAIRQQLDQSVLAYLQNLFPARDGAMWASLQDDLARQDPTRVHTFDLFMRVTELAEPFSPAQLQAMAERLSQIDIFRDISLADLENLSRAIEAAHFEDGTLLWDKGDAGDAMFLIETGAIGVYAVDSEQREKHLRSFGGGQVVGDFVVLDGEPRSARARAEGALSVMVLRREVFQMFIQSRPQVILAVLGVLAERARYTTHTVEVTIQTLSSIAQGDYGHPMPSPEALESTPALTEIAPEMPAQLNRSLARLAARLQAREAEAS